MKKMIAGFIVLLGFGMSGCSNIRGVKFNIPYQGYYGKQTYKRKSHTTRAKIKQNYSKSCRGIRITGVGQDRFRGMVPYKYVSVVNNSSQRREVTLDIKWRKHGYNKFYGAYDDTTWRTFGPEVLRPGESSRFVVDKAGRSDMSIVEVAVGKCE